jgi:hypothetical protein
MEYVVLALALVALGFAVTAMAYIVKLSDMRAERDLARFERDAEKVRGDGAIKARADDVARLEGVISLLKTEIWNLEGDLARNAATHPDVVRDRLRRLLQDPSPADGTSTEGGVFAGPVTSGSTDPT